MEKKMEHVIVKTEELFAARAVVARIESELGALIGADPLAAHRAAPRDDSGRSLVSGAAAMFADIPRPGALLDASTPSFASTDTPPARVFTGARSGSTSIGLVQRVREVLAQLPAQFRARDVLDKLAMETDQMKFVSSALAHLTNKKALVKVDTGLYAVKPVRAKAARIARKRS